MMTSINNVRELHEEIARLEIVCRQQEENMLRHADEIKESFEPVNIVLKAVSALAGKTDHRDNDGLWQAISQFFRLLLKNAVKLVENKLYEGLKKFLGNIIDPEVEKKKGTEEDA
jgi:hypothetical protein